MSRSAIATSSAPNAVGPYSQAIVAGDFVFCSGQGAIDAATNEMRHGTIEEETRVTLKNSNLNGAVFTNALLSSRQGPYSLTLMMTATPLIGLGLMALGIAVTAWIVQSSAGGAGSGRGPNYDLYSRARQTSLDDPPEL